MKNGNIIKILYGEPIARKIYQTIRIERKKIKAKPGLAIIMVGDDKASKIYVGLEEKQAKKLGFFILSGNFYKRRRG